MDRTLEEARLLATALRGMVPDTQNLASYRKGTVVSIQTGPPPTCTVNLSGDTTAIPGVYFMDGYNPEAGDVVLMLKQGGSLLILGSVCSELLPNPYYVVKPALESRASTTTFADDDTLTAPVLAGYSYEVEFLLTYSAEDATDTNTPGFKTTWVTPSGTSGRKNCMGPTNSTTAGNYVSRIDTMMRFATHNLGTTVNYGVSNNDGGTFGHIAIEKGLIDVTTDGAVTLQWAQTTSHANATRVDVYSYLKLTRLP